LTGDETRKRVREGYARIAVSQSSCCGSSKAEDAGRKIGYAEGELRSVPQGANMNLGCGNPVALASLREGETVVDLGSGGGLDCFLAAKRVGEKGRVIGVDMTPEMIDKARRNAQEGRYKNVEFRLGEIENLPVADGTADVVISNCVINLVPDKKRVFEEAFRILKPQGRLMVSDIVLQRELPEDVRREASPASCVQGAIMKDEYIGMIKQAGFQEVKVVRSAQYGPKDAETDLDSEVIVLNSKTNVEEVKKVSELEGKARETVMSILAATLSVDVLAIKP
jgi:ubiquinone/menaquinone biosynthesis C-methylase UbiE